MGMVFGRVSIPKSCSMRRYQVSSSLAYKSTHSSSVIWLRHCKKGAASGPTKWRSCQDGLSTTSKILSATNVGGTGVLSEASNREAKRACCG